MFGVRGPGFGFGFSMRSTFKPQTVPPPHKGREELQRYFKYVPKGWQAISPEDTSNL